MPARIAGANRRVGGAVRRPGKQHDQPEDNDGSRAIEMATSSYSLVADSRGAVQVQFIRQMLD
jgi:hypothetical protein